MQITGILWKPCIPCWWTENLPNPGDQRNRSVHQMLGKSSVQTATCNKAMIYVASCSLQSVT